jgi:hypothetical protein
MFIVDVFAGDVVTVNIITANATIKDLITIVVVIMNFVIIDGLI